MLVGLTLAVLALAARGLSANRVIRSRAVTSALLFLAYAIAAVVAQRLAVDADMARQLQIIQETSMVFGSINLLVTLAINPWRADRTPDRFPGIVQYSIILGLFLVVSMLVVGRGFLATATAGAVIVGLALQDTLGNFFAGLAIQIEKPFRVGDWVNLWEDGMVMEVTWRATKIRTKNGHVVIVPNNVVAKNTVTNYSQPALQVRLEVEVGVSYDSPPNVVKATIRTAIADEPLIDRSREIDVLIVNFADSSVTYRVRVWMTDFAADQRLCDSIRSRINYAFRRDGIVIPFPINVRLEHRRPTAHRDRPRHHSRPAPYRRADGSAGDGCGRRGGLDAGVPLRRARGSEVRGGRTPG